MAALTSLTELSGDQQARIPIRGEPLKGAAAACGRSGVLPARQ